MTKRLIIKGVVQGVGFRPFVYKVAKSMGLKGWVSNTSEGVIIEVNLKDDYELQRFIEMIKTEKPSASHINSIDVMDCEEKNFADFDIKESISNNKNDAYIPSDLKICEKCISDIFDLNNRRYLYPFTNCTECGPRFTITKKIPYDRKNTTMHVFKMCKDCEEEYNNPLDRRFHAQPNACIKCGPDVWCYDGKKRLKGINAIDFIVKSIIDGGVVLIKGIGGFHIACDAFNKNAVEKVRIIKKREFKPLAIMIDDVDDVKEFVYVSDIEREILNSSVAPILCLKKKNFDIFEYVAPSIKDVGIMLAYTPLHKIVFKRLKEKGFKNPLVMTSGNYKDEPIIKDNDMALKRFGNYPILFHNRDIHNRVDDSVGFVDDNGFLRLIRRARGFVPSAISIRRKFPKEVFACGGDIKNSFGFYRNGDVILSQHIGDLDLTENIDFFKETFINMKKLYGFKPEILACDMHPLYRSSYVAKNFGISKKIYVQHHVAHMYSVMAEFSFDNDVIGISYDGTGYGVDGNIWGGEIFVVRDKKVIRSACLENFPLYGGDISVKEIWRVFASVFRGYPDFVRKVLSGLISSKTVDIFLKLLNNSTNMVYTSSIGRLFDAISVVCNKKVFADFEAEGPMRMEAMIDEDIDDLYDFKVEDRNGFYIIRFSDILGEIIRDFENEKFSLISTKFHNSIIKTTVDAVLKISGVNNKIKRVVLSGGVFQNRYILSKLTRSLSERGFEVYSNVHVPVNDGGIALGQIYYTILGHRLV